MPKPDSAGSEHPDGARGYRRDAPWPVNGGGGTTDTANTFWAEYGKTDSLTVETKWSVSGSVTVSKGVAFKKRGELKAKLTAGVKVHEDHFEQQYGLKGHNPEVLQQ